MKSKLPPSLVVERLRIKDPRAFGRGDASSTLDILRLIELLTVAPLQHLLDALEIKVFDYLHAGDNSSLNAALAACRDQESYELLYGLVARMASESIGHDTHLDTNSDEDQDQDIHYLFGIPLTLHRSHNEQARNWMPPKWGPSNNAPDLAALSRILAATGVTDGMRDLVLLPHLVDPSAFEMFSFSEMQQLATQLATDPTCVAAGGKLPHSPWQPIGDEAQCRVLVLAARSRTDPLGLEEDNQECAAALIHWAQSCFKTSDSAKLLAGSPERLQSLLTGKGLHMFNCAKLVHLLGLPIPRDGSSPFLAATATSTQPCQGEIRFSVGGNSCVWNVHGRQSWGHELDALQLLIPEAPARFVRVQLGLDSRPPPHWSRF